MFGFDSFAAQPYATAPSTAAAPPTKRDEAGRRRSKRQRKPVVVEVDGQEIVVETVEEAEALAEKVRADAQQLAEQALQRAAAVQRRPRRKVLQDARKALALPSIEVDGKSLIANLLRSVISDVRSLFESTIRDIEIGALMRQRQQLEEDDEDVLMLLL